MLRNTATGGTDLSEANLKNIPAAEIDTMTHLCANSGGVLLNRPVFFSRLWLRLPV